nr:hypothetical protein [uncultured Streptomyces sp.]
MAADQLPAEVGEFATYLDGLLARLDPSGGWCAVFWQRDPEGMRACLDGRDMPPWDVVEALLQDLAGQYGPGGAGPETERARALHAAAIAVYDTRPGGRDALGDRLDVMLREQKYAAERQAALARHLTSATTREQADALRVDLAWARDDHARAGARCVELRARMAQVDRREREAPPAVWGDADGLRGAGAGSPAAAPQRSSTGSASAPAGRYGAADPGPGSPGRQRPAARGVSEEAVAGAAPDPAPAGSSGRPGTTDPEAAWPARQHPMNRSVFGEPAAEAAPEVFADPAGSGAGWSAQQHPASRSRSGEAGAGAASDGFIDPAGSGAGWSAQRHPASRSRSGEARAGAASEAFPDRAGTETGQQAQAQAQAQAHRTGPGAFPDPAGTGVGQDTPQRVADGSMPGGVRGDGAPGELSAPTPEPPAPQAR